MFPYIDGSYAEWILQVEATRIRPAWEDRADNADKRIRGSRGLFTIAAIAALGVGALKLVRYL